MIFQLKLESLNKKCLNLYLFFIFKIFSGLNIKNKTVFLPKKKKYIKFLKSSHVHKKAQEHFVFTKFCALIIFKHNKLLNILFNKPNTIKAKLSIKL